MLFLNTKHMVAVLALGSLLSVSYKAEAAWPLNAEQTTVLVAGPLAYLATHQIDHTKKEKGAVTKATDTGAEVVQGVLNHSYAKKAAYLAAFGFVVHYRATILKAFTDFGSNLLTFGAK